MGHALVDQVLPLAQPVRQLGITLTGLEGAAEQPHPQDRQLTLL